jgi:hypothetical protein
MSAWSVRWCTYLSSLICTPMIATATGSFWLSLTSVRMCAHYNKTKLFWPTGLCHDNILTSEFHHSTKTHLLVDVSKNRAPTFKCTVSPLVAPLSTVIIEGANQPMKSENWRYSISKLKTIQTQTHFHECHQSSRSRRSASNT